jgi:tellurite resistance protein TerC
VYLKTGLALILVYIGIKMLLLDVLHIPSLVSLGVIIAILAISVVASLVFGKPEEPTTDIVAEAEFEAN